MHELGRYLQREIDRRGWSIGALARHASISRQTLYSLIKDDREVMDQTPQRKTINALAEALNVDPLEILTASAKALGVPIDESKLGASLGTATNDQILAELSSRLSGSKGQDNESQTPTPTTGTKHLRAVAPEGDSRPGQKNKPDYGITEIHGADARNIPVPPREKLAAHPKVKTTREKLDESTGERDGEF